MKPLRFWQDQLPNGMITDSSNRLVFLVGWLVIFLMVIAYVIAKIVWKVTPDYALLGIVITAVTGQKMYQKYVESQNQSESTPQEAKETK